MPRYSYKAKQGPGRTVEGDVQAESHAAAVALLEARGLIPVSVVLKPIAERRFRLNWHGHVPATAITLFTRQLASLTRAGVPILRALATIEEQTENRRLREILQASESGIREGGTLSGQLARHTDLFPALYISMMRSGEAAGVVDTVLDRLADAREAEEDLRRKLQAAVAYPAVVAVVGAATILVLLTFFLPRVAALFKNVGALPLPTRGLIALATGLREYGWVALVFLALAGLLLRRMLAHDRTRTRFDAGLLRLPLIGRFLLEADLARFASTLSLLLTTGIPIDRALTLSAGVLGNLALRQAVFDARDRAVRQGQTLSRSLRQSPLFPAFLSNMAAVGEESGRLDESLKEIAQYYARACDQRAKLAASLIEPALILIVGAAVGFIVAAMLLPIFKLGTAF